jgi:hypothetical protein
MSSPIHHANDLDPALMYAPPRVREQGPPASSESSAPPVDWPWRRHPDDNPDFSGDRKIIEVQRRLTLDPEWVPEPPSAVDGRDLWRITLRAGGVLGFAALVAWVVVSIPSLRLIGSEAVQATFPGTSISAYLGAPIPPTIATKTRPERPSAQTILADKAVQEARRAQEAASRPEPNEPSPAAAAPPTFATAALTQPTPVQPMPVQPMPVQPMPVQPTPVVTTREPILPSPPPPPQRTAPDFVTRQLDRDELSSLLQRADDFIKSGDLSSARLLLRRAAEAGNVYAALTLAGTFDPNVLSRLGFQEGAADVAMARLWYERAEKFGSAEAPRRLQQLTTAVNSAR